MSAALNPMPTRTPEDIELATDIFMQLHRLSLESLQNLLASVHYQIQVKKDIARAQRKAAESKVSL